MLQRDHQVARVFAFADVDRSGDISYGEWENAFGDAIKQADLKQLFSMMDTDQNGLVSWQEFKLGMETIPAAEVLLALDDLDDRAQRLHAASCKHM